MSVYCVFYFVALFNFISRFYYLDGEVISRERQ